MKKIIQLLFPEKTKWVDIGHYDNQGYYYLLQMRATIKTNRKEFRKARVGFVNDFTQKVNIFENMIKNIAP